MESENEQTSESGKDIFPEEQQAGAGHLLVELMPADAHSALHPSSAPLVTEFEPWSATVSDSYG